MSVNVKTQYGLKQIADKTTKNKVLKVLGYTPANEEDLINHRGDAIIHISSTDRKYWDNKPETYAELKEKPSIYEDLPGTLYIVDKNSNVIARVDDKGIHTTAIEVLTSENKTEDIVTFVNDSILELYYELKEQIITDYNKLDNIPIVNEEKNDGLYISDKEGNINTIIDKKGISTLNVYAKEFFEENESISSKYIKQESVLTFEDIDEIFK